MCIFIIFNRPANESYPVNAKIPKTNANQYQNIDPNQSNAAPPKKQRNRNRGQWRNKNKKGKNKGQNQNVQNVQQMNQPCNQNKQQQKNKKPDKQQRNRNNQQQQQNSSFTPYNYTAVDFRQFQGGAGEVSKPQAVKAAFKNRVSFLGLQWYVLLQNVLFSGKKAKSGWSK